MRVTWLWVVALLGSACVRPVEEAPVKEPVLEDGVSDDDDDARFAVSFDTKPESGRPDRTAQFAFHATRENARFFCALDAAMAAECRSPTGFFGLPYGEHVFVVRAVDPVTLEEDTLEHRWSIVDPNAVGPDDDAGPDDGGPDIDEPRSDPLEPNGDLAHATVLDRLSATVTSAISHGGDRDVYRFELEGPAALVLETHAVTSLETCDGDTIVELLDDSGGWLAADDVDGVEGLCGRIAPELDGAARYLQPGTYYVRVSAPLDVETTYTLDVLLASRCGNGALEAFEQCDDGNRVAGDRCDDLCRNEAFCGDGMRTGEEQCDDGNTLDSDGCTAACLLDEHEPNDTSATAMPLSVPGVLSASFDDVSDVDFYSFTLTQAASIRLETLGIGAAPCPGDTVIELFDATEESLAWNDEGGAPPCSLLDPLVLEDIHTLPPGSYTLSVGVYTQGVGPYLVKASVLATCGDGTTDAPEQCDDGNDVEGDGCNALCRREPRCGDRLVELQEHCDDGNTVAGDGCSPLCRFERDEIEPNNTILAASPLAAGVRATGALWPDEDVDHFAVELTKPGSLAVLVTSMADVARCTGDPQLDVLDAQGLTIASDGDDGPGNCPRLDPQSDVALRMLPAGRYILRVRTYFGAAIADYAVTATTTTVCGDGALQPYETCDDGNNAAGDGCGVTCVAEPRCGNGVLEANEACDDGNGASGDGCAAACVSERFEREPNDQLPQANDLGPLDTFIQGTLATGSDKDTFAFTLETVSAVRIEVTGATGPASCPGDTVVEVLDELGAIVTQDDDSGNANCSLLDPTTNVSVRALLPGRHVLRLRAYGGAVTTPYVLRLRIEWACGDGALDMNEWCDDGNAIDGDGCSSTCQLDEIEPNDAIVDADEILGFDLVHAADLGAGDRDFFAFFLSSPEHVVITTRSLDDPNACPGDTTLALYDAQSHVVARDDQGGIDDCAVLSTRTALPTRLPAGWYYVRVTGFDDEPIGVYAFVVEKD